MLKIGRRLAILGMLAMTMAACGDDDDDNPTTPTNITGTYTLRTVNGQQPPAMIFQAPGFRLDIRSAALTLNSGGTFDMTIGFRETDGTTTGTPDDYEEDFTGTWTRTGNTIQMVDEFEDEYTGTVQGDGAIVFSNIQGLALTARFTK